VPKILSTSNRGRYSAVQVLLLFWNDDDDVKTVQDAVRELAHVLEKSYHYTFHIHAIPSASDGLKSSWRWLSRLLNDFAEDRDQRDVLKIVYYNGHTYLDGDREMILARYVWALQYKHEWKTKP
jgi:spermidine synthase